MDFVTPARFIGDNLTVAVSEALERVTMIEDRFKSHPAELACCCSSKLNLREIQPDAFSKTEEDALSPFRVAIVSACAAIEAKMMATWKGRPILKSSSEDVQSTIFHPPNPWESRKNARMDTAWSWQH